VRGFLKINKNRFDPKYLFFLILPILLLVSCKTTKELDKKEETGASFKEFLSKYEKTFDPSAYNEDVESILIKEKLQRESIELARFAAIAPPETTQGFRVQVLFTPEIEQANEARDSLSNLLPDDWCYIVYEAPYYKVRIGNYADRSDAGGMQMKLVRLGYLDAWIVPDKIIKNPYPRPPELFIVPDKQPEQKR